ncbi:MULTISPECIES: hypothetical protein [Bacillus]|uniref:hypothetical protein n=1 Tax=Bacillus TaxID=1386 RepID=UPI0002DF70E0|nr:MULTISPECIES: hypothetical protein [Bacillus]
MGIFDDIEEKFQEIPDGHYVVRVEGYSREKTIHGAKPLKWQLKLMHDEDIQLPTKFSHIETNAGFHILLRELKELGYQKPQNARELEDILNSLIGCLLEIYVVTTNKEEGYRDVKLIRKLY